MTTTLIRCRRLFAALLAISFVALAPLGGRGENAALPEEQAKKIAEIEKQIAELKARIKELKEGKDHREPLSMPRLVDEERIPESWVRNFSWRAIGPAIMGGRITSIAVAADDASTYYVGTASGGLLKTSNNGTTYEHQFDKEASVSIGAVAVAPSNKNIVWVGTGEANPRNSVSYGDGVYKSVDGGKTWQNMGLKKSFQIGAIVIHPKDPNIVYVGVLGRLYGPSEERGLFKTADGGKTWNRVHYVDDKTGVINVVMHPSNPEMMIVATWERQRDEFDSFRGEAKPPAATDVYGPSKVHGPGSGLWRTTDGGKTFTKLTKGLPTVAMGRVGIDYSRKNPNTVFAIIDTVDAGKGIPPSRAFLGITGSTVKDGAKLDSVGQNSPAAKAGLAVGDIVIALDGKEVKSYQSFLETYQPKKPGDKVKLTILRGKEKKDIEVTLGTREPAKKDGRRPPPMLGVQIEDVEGGLLIAEVVKDSPAEKGGLKADDVIVEVDGHSVANARALTQILSGKRTGDRLKIVYLRGKEKKDVEVTLEAPQLGTPERPYSGGNLAGQRANAQDTQGPDGWQTGGIYKSTDNGESWTRINSLNERPFYFSLIRVDPNDDNVIWVGGVNLWRSRDGGKNFSTDGVNGGLHADQHALWINPKDSRHILVGCDGGLYVTFDQAAHWEHMNRTALGQFYHVAVDNRTPYNVYGGLQDNGSWGGPSQTNRNVGPINEDWRYVNGGDGFVCRVDSFDPDLVYAESQDGNMMRRNMRTGDSRVIRPRSVAGLGRFRWNWNTPFILSSHNPGIFYCAANYVFRSVKHGDDLRVISPEITRTKRGTGTAVAESPRNPEVLWAGTDDGAVWVTRNGGRDWTNISDKFKAAGLPGPRWVSSIEPSRTEEGRCYICFDAHRSNDDEPYLFVTEDYGQTWRSIRSKLPSGSSRVIREDITSPDLLYVGTEFGAWASVNRGESWSKLHVAAAPIERKEPKKGGGPGGRRGPPPRVTTQLPTVAVHEFAQPETANDLVVATHGRSLWVLDITALRQMTTAVVKSEKPTLFKPETAVRWQIQPGRQVPFSESQRKFIGQNPARGASIEYALPRKASKVSLKIVDITGRTMRELTASVEPGLHREEWDLRKVSILIPGIVAGGPAEAELQASPIGRFLMGREVPPGSYRVVLNVDGQEFSQPLAVEPDPNAPREALIAVDEAEEDLKYRKEQKALQNLEPSEDD